MTEKERVAQLTALTSLYVDLVGLASVLSESHKEWVLDSDVTFYLDPEELSLDESK